MLQGRYDVAMRDYKKGKFLMESRPGQLLPLASKKEGQTSAEEQQKRILDKIWSTVDKVIADLRKQLLGKLQEPTRSFEEHEKTIEYEFWISFDAVHFSDPDI